VRAPLRGSAAELGHVRRLAVVGQGLLVGVGLDEQE
jgi:hypothetical protein